MTRKKSPPAPIGAAVESFLRKSGLATRVEQTAVIPKWKSLVGPQIAAVTEPLMVSSEGTLLVGVTTSAWMSELSLMEPQLLREINKEGGIGRIKKLRFRLLR